MDRPKGALSPAELDKLLDRYGRVRVYSRYLTWAYFTKEPNSTKYGVVNKWGREHNLSWPDVCYGMENFSDYQIFVNYWHYYAFMLKQGKHAELLP